MNYQHKNSPKISPHKITNMLKNINKYCFDSKNIIELDLLSKKQNNNRINEKFTEKTNFTEKSTKEIPEFFIPYNLDSSDDIFWCWYIFQYGYFEYNIQKNKPFSVEKETKINWVTLLRENKASIKELKYKLVHLENNLVNEKNMNIITLETICFINNIDFYIVKNKMLYKNSNNNEHCIVLKYCADSKKYAILLDNIQIHKKIEKFEQDLFLVQNIENPMKSISSYKLKELQDIATKLDIELKRKDGQKDSHKNKTKKCLYSEIQEILV